MASFVASFAVASNWRQRLNGLFTVEDLASAPQPVNSAFRLTWTAPYGEHNDVYEVELSHEFTTNSQTLTAETNALSLTEKLASDTTYNWRVRAKGGAWSDTSTFDTAPDPPAWGDAAWIGGGSELRTDWAIPKERSVVRARAYASGLGAMELHINGAKARRARVRTRNLLLVRSV